MPVEIQWLIPERVILAEVSGNLRENEIRQMAAKGEAMLEAGTPPLYWLADTTHLDTPVTNLASARKVLQFLRDERLAWLIRYGNQRNPIINWVSGVLTHGLGLRYRWFPDQEQALEFLQEIDPSLELPQPDEESTLEPVPESEKQPVQSN